jgi:hypothetical protein
MIANKRAVEGGMKESNDDDVSQERNRGFLLIEM